jgi:hypothetical protein
MTAPSKAFMYLLNAFELASQADKPAEHGYGVKRAALLDYVAKLESTSDAELPVGEPEVCKWMEDDPWGVMPGTYASQCGEMWSFIDGGPTENHVRYCHGCGKPVRVVPFPVEPEEEEVGSGERGE